MTHKLLILTAAAIVTAMPALAQNNAPIAVETFKQPVKLACVGDSITRGVGAKRPWPRQLGAMLGPQWEVGNFGVNGATLMNSGDKPYQKLRDFKSAMDFAPDVVVIMLGTNDTKPNNWKHFESDYEKDYLDMVGQFAKLENKPRIFICHPPYIAKEGNWGINDPDTKAQMPVIEKVAKALNVGIIDVHAALEGQDELIPDKVHPNTEGAKLIAEAVFKGLTGKPITSPNTDFGAYHTHLSPSPVGAIGKYEDLVVMLGKTNRLEFARAKGYLPQWRTEQGVHQVENLITNTSEDTNCFYNYVRLMEQDPEKIVVQWRRFKDAERVAKANEALDPLDPHGITGVIQERFTIYPDGRVEREIRDAANTRYQDWIDPRLATRQNLKLTDRGIEHGPVTPGQKPPLLPRAAVKGSPVKATKGLPVPLYYWTFDDGMQPHEDQVKEAVSGSNCEITGLMTQFKPGVSGTALALDGYYTGVTLPSKPASHATLTVAAWVALDAYPYNTAPFVHHSKGFGTQGWYLGLDAYGHPLVTVAGQSVKAAEFVLPLYQWVHVCATLGAGKLRLYVDGKELASGDFTGTLTTPDTALLLGRNNEPERNTDPVRNPKHNLLFVFGIQGLLDDVSIYSQALSPAQVLQAYSALCPSERSSALAKGVLPGELGVAKQFGAFYKSLPFSDVWDQLWRDLPGAEIVVKFDKNPCSVVYWRGSNYAPNWVTDNNRWMADQSSENGGPHGCSEHMADKQIRHSHSRIIENTSARVLIHWRYPCVDVSYKNLNPKGWTDEYHTIYPDGTGVRHVVFNGRGGAPGPAFQDIQFLTNPGEAPLDVLNLQAMTLANLAGETRELTWALPNVIPKNTLPDARIEVLNSKSEHKVFAMFQGGFINPWGANEQSKYISDPFPGPWNHWPMHLTPSDGRFAVATDRVTHFAVGANDASVRCGSMVLYGFTRQPAASLVPLARSWNQPPDICALAGCKVSAYQKETRDFPLVAEKETLTVKLAATQESPLVNPCFTIRNWGHTGVAQVKAIGAEAKDVRQGVINDTDGTKTMVIWLDLSATSDVTVTISGAKP